MPGPETKLRLTMKDKSFVTLESFTKSGNHVGVLNTGQLKSALATGKEVDGQFGVRLIVSANLYIFLVFVIVSAGTSTFN